MQRRNQMIGIAAAVGMLLLIMDGKTALAGAGEGVELCIRTVIPSLFPFFVMSILLTGSLSGIRSTLLRPLGQLFRIPEGSEPILLTGFLGGYPVGAQCVSNAYRSGQLTKAQAQRMLYFCNNAGPSFLFGIVASQFPGAGYAWLLWGIQLLSAFLVARTISSVDNTPVVYTGSGDISITKAMNRAITVMASVCSWVVLFRVMIAFANRWFLWLLPADAQVLVTGLFELTNGCCSLASVENIALRFLMCSVMLAFGGLCVTMQTISVIQGLDWKPCLSGKLLQSVYSLILAVICQWILGQSQLPNALFALSILFVFLFLLRKLQKRGSASKAVRV